MIPHNRPTIGVEEKNAILRVLDSGNLIQGNETQLFEKEFCNYISLSQEHAVTVSSGTAALYLSLWALGVKNQVITFPAYVCPALDHAVNLAGAQRKLIDIGQNSPNIDIKKISSEKNISIVPHMFGIPIDLTNFRTNGFIEDCSQALGAKINGKSVGLFGTLGIFSFYATKIITTGGQGGIIVSNNTELIESIRKIIDYNDMRDNLPKFNFQLTEIQAAIGREQLKKLPQFLAKRNQIFNRYLEAGLELMDISPELKKNIEPVRYRALVKTTSPKKMKEHLLKKDITTIIPMEGWFDG